MKSKRKATPSAWKFLHKHPPGLVRVYGRRTVNGKHVEAITLQEIAIASGIPLFRVKEITHSKTWADVTVSEAERFCVACNFDPLNAADRNRQGAYQRAASGFIRPLKFMRDAETWETEYMPLIEELRRAI